MAKKIIIAYIPVIHEGYRRLFAEHQECRELYVVGRDVTGRFRHLQKDLRALDPEMACEALEGWNCFDLVAVADEAALQRLRTEDVEVVMPNEEVSHELHDRYFSKNHVTFSPIFLRWDRRRSSAHTDVEADAVIAADDLSRQMMGRAYDESQKSSNIWRRVGAVLAKNKEIIAYSSNRHRPTAHTPWIDGDVRANFNKGVGVEMSTDQHAESCVIADAARRGIALEGAQLYVTTFPCPPCSMLVAYSGIKTLYYAEGYAVLDGERVLRAQGVEICKVTVPTPEEDEKTYVPYPES